MARTAQEKLEWAVARALALFDCGAINAAIGHFTNDVTQDPDTQHIGTPDSIRKTLQTAALQGREAFKQALLSFNLE